MNSPCPLLQSSSTPSPIFHKNQGANLTLYPDHTTKSRSESTTPMRDARPGKRPLLVTLPLKVQTYDIDFAFHVNNQVYVRWLEDLRMEVLREYYPLKRFMDAGVAPILASTQITYKRPVGLYDEPMGYMWATHLGRASIWLEAEIRVGDMVCAHAIQRGSFLVLATGKASRTPEELLVRFEAGNV